MGCCFLADFRWIIVSIIYLELLLYCTHSPASITRTCKDRLNMFELQELQNIEFMEVGLLYSHVMLIASGCRENGQCINRTSLCQTVNLKSGAVVIQTLPKHSAKRTILLARRCPL